MNGFDGLLKVAVVATLVGALTGCMGAPGDEAAAATGDLCASGGLRATTYAAAPGTVVTWTGSATCTLPNPEFQFWMLPPGGAWTVVQAFSNTTTYAWNTTGLSAGTYGWQVWIREAGSTQYVAETYGDRTFLLSAGTDPCTTAGVAAAPTGATVVGRPVTLTATASCGASTPTYQFYHLAPGGSWQVAQAYSATATYAWDTTGAAVGQHQFQVWARRQGATSSYEKYAVLSYSIKASDACTAVTSAASPAGSAVLGQSVTISSSGTCGTATPTYEVWHLAPGGSWQVDQAYSTATDFVWNTTGATVGQHQFQIRARAQGSAATFEAYATVIYQVTATDTCSSTTLAASPSSPSTRGTSVTWTATSSGCVSPTYQFWLYSPAHVWSIAKAYSASPTFVWDTTTVPSGAYEVQVWVRAAGYADSYQAYAAAGYTVGYTATTSTTNLAAGLYHTCILRVDGTVNCWGNNIHGELGNGTTANSATPVVVTGLSGVSAISSGYTHTCAVVSGAVSCWGENTRGQLGDGTTTSASTPVTVPGIAGAVAVTGGGAHTCALLTDGTVSCWGFNTQGQLGTGSQTPAASVSPVTVVGISNAVAIEAGYYHTCALLSTGLVKCWGSNDFGQLGDGTTTRSFTPVTVSGLSDVRSISTAGSSNCAVLFDGTAACWGANAAGQLGNGATANSSSPVVVTGLASISTLSEGHLGGCAVLTDNTARCWGTNTYGELGDGTTTSSTVPVTVATLTGAASIIVGGYHSCARLNDNTARCWGYATQGELGNGLTTNSTAPVVVSLP